MGCGLYMYVYIYIYTYVYIYIYHQRHTKIVVRQKQLGRELSLNSKERGPPL